MNVDGDTLIIRRAQTASDIGQCQALIRRVYLDRYNVTFASKFDLNAGIEKFPHRFLMGLVGQRLAVTVGIYDRVTYVERFGRLPPDRMQQAIDQSNSGLDFRAENARELTKLAVDPLFEGCGLVRPFFSYAMSDTFLQDNATAGPAALVMATTTSIRKILCHDVNVHTRSLGRFPIYPAHQAYASVDDPMESYLIIPDLDIPISIRKLNLPANVPNAGMRFHDLLGKT